MKKRLAAVLLGLSVITSALSGCGGSSGSSKDFPTKDLSAVCYYAAGGTTDTCVRSVINAIPKKDLSKNIIVSNVAGGSGLVGFNQFMNTEADGYTIGVYNCDMVLSYALGNTDVDSSKVIPLAMIEQDPYLLVVAKDAPYNTFEEFVKYCKENPGKVSIGDTGEGAVPHLVYTALNKKLGLDVTTVSYDSSANSVLAVVSGECMATVAAPGAAQGQLEADAVKAIASTGKKRLDSYPDVPTMAETFEELKDMNILSWITLAVREGAPDEAVTYLTKIFSEAAASEGYAETLKSFSFQAVPKMEHKDILSFVAEQQTYYESLIK
ncbi:hypothetical protein GCWU000282_01004 [Catonella morbi ATCC 51271]|uniref:Tripartite tricarboxylate transporter family receptor n=1 Tax=Catonella morbi ATCC 51271 TaxID=592026 RepID=V2Y6W3_9FIRM|nr:tripartite tricarboxylate transporter substrate binding protein [Catonella morbi]ESL03837.1 hypothetical protein GCWU000282_01004 [Catonella morbi ATCC 51271]